MSRCIHRLRPRRAGQGDGAEESDRAFDQKHGVDTEGVVDPSRNMVAGSNWISGIKYQAVNPDWFHRVIKGLSIPPGKFVFIDFGSGKGRALLLASGFPFKKIVGVEYCDDLNRIARQNLISYASESKICNDINIVCMDASEYILPNEPLVMFFYNPFGRSVMKEVVSNVVDSFQLNPRRIVIVYLNAEFAYLWDRLSFLKRDRTGRAIWDSGVPPD